MNTLRKMMVGAVLVGGLLPGTGALRGDEGDGGLAPVQKDRKVGVMDRKLHGVWVHQHLDAETRKETIKAVEFLPNQRFVYFAASVSGKHDKRLLGFSGIYAVRDGKVLLTPDAASKALGVLEFEYQIKGDELLLSIGEESSTTFVRQLDEERGSTALDGLREKLGRP